MDENEVVEYLNALISSCYADDTKDIEFSVGLLLAEIGIENFHFAKYPSKIGEKEVYCTQVFLNRYHE